MPVGTPDFNQNLSSSPTVQSFDTGEDTTRLLMGGGSNSRSGRWIWATGFESGDAEIVRGGTLPTIYKAQTYQGAACLQLKTTAVNGNSSFFAKTIPSTLISTAPSNRFGWESMISFLFAGNPFELLWYIIAQHPQTIDKVLKFRIVLAHTGGSAKLYTEETLGNRVLIDDITKYISSNTTNYNFAKFVFDVNAMSYTRFLFNDRVFDLGGAPCEIANISNPLYYFSLNLVTKSNYSIIAQVDNVIITGDEP